MPAMPAPIREGQWVKKKDLPQRWQVRYGALTFNIKPMNFKHTGLFPEQAANWDFAMEQIQRAGRPVSVLNLFAYTGAATLACAAAGASVCHVDAARGWSAGPGKTPRALVWRTPPSAGLWTTAPNLWSGKSVGGRRYDAVIMDPPSYGRGPSGKFGSWRRTYTPLWSWSPVCCPTAPSFFLINSYTTGLAPSVLTYLLETLLSRRYGGSTVSDELGLPVTHSGLMLPCGATGRWTAEGK